MPAHAEHIERLGGHSDRLSVQRPSSQFERHSARLSTRRSGQHDRPKSVIDMEVGVIDAVPRRPGPGKGPTRVSQRRLDFEQHRPRWLQEMIAEAIGIFICIYTGLAASASLLINHRNAAAGSVLETGFAYGISIPLAIVTCAPTSGGHFNPAITLCFAFWKGFPWWKVPHYIFAQITGAFLAALCVMVQYRQQIQIFKAESLARGHGVVYAGGPASILVTLPGRMETHLGILFMTEWIADTYVAIVTWAALDTANTFSSVIPAPFTIGLAYASIIWGFSATTLSMNLARDLGARLVAFMFFSKEVFTYMHFSWIPILVNIPATFIATGFYEMVMRNSLLNIHSGGAVHADGEEALERHLRKHGLKIEKGVIVAADEDEDIV